VKRCALVGGLAAQQNDETLESDQTRMLGRPHPCSRYSLRHNEDRTLQSRKGDRPDVEELGNAVYLLALHEEIDRLRELPLATGIPGILLFFALVSFLFVNTDLGVIRTFLAGLVVGSPGLVLVARDLRVTRRIRLLERQVEAAEEECVAKSSLACGDGL
jgi:hypothetical protein